MYCGPIDSRDELWNEYLEKKTVLHVSSKIYIFI